MKTKTIFLLFSMIILSACQSPNGAEEPIIPKEGPIMHIEGIVTDQITDEPINGVRIEIEEWDMNPGRAIVFTAYTNENGKYTINKQYPGDCSDKMMLIHATKEGYRDEHLPYLDKNAIPYLSCTDELQRVDIELWPYSGGLR
jgi:hypothetical protein